MNERKHPMERHLKKALIITVLLFIAVLSATILAEHFMKPDTYSDIIISIDERKSSVMSLAAASTVASAGISAIPDDTATPIADKLADLSGYFLLILIVLYAEKYLLTILGALVFRILIPIACILGIVSLFPGKRGFRRVSIKLALVALLLAVTIPVGVIASNMVYKIYETSIDTTIQSAEEFSKELNREDAGFWDRLTGAVSTLIEKASGVLSRFVEALAVIIVSSCVIPIVSLLFFLWLIRLIITGENPVQYLQQPADRKPDRALPPSDSGRIPPKLPPER